MYHRFGHLKDMEVKVGDYVKVGDLIGHVGNTGNSTGAHLHYDVRFDQKTPTEYVDTTMGKKEVLAAYDNPYNFIKRDKNIPCEFDHTGYDFCEAFRSGKGILTHPGVDLNGKDNDEGNDIVSPIEGRVCYVQTADKGHGWGNMMVIREFWTSDLEKAQTFPRLQDWVQAIKKAEGWKERSLTNIKGSLSFQNNNPGNIKFTNFTFKLGGVKENKGFSYFDTLQDGIDALTLFLYYSCVDAMRDYKSNMTIEAYCNVYSPGCGDGYIDSIVKDLGVTRQTTIKEIMAQPSTTEVQKEVIKSDPTIQQTVSLTPTKNYSTYILVIRKFIEKAIIGAVGSTFLSQVPGIDLIAEIAAGVILTLLLLGLDWASNVAEKKYHFKIIQ